MAANVVYTYPVAGTTPPTVAQAAAVNSLSCQIAMLDEDTAALITHNWQLTSAQLANLWPWLRWYLSTAGTAIPILSFALTNSVLVTITKVSAAGSGGSYNFILERPHSIVA